jgi:hypothetical protein
MEKNHTNLTEVSRHLNEYFEPGTYRKHSSLLVRENIGLLEI